MRCAADWAYWRGGGGFLCVGTSICVFGPSYPAPCRRLYGVVRSSDLKRANDASLERYMATDHEELPESLAKELATTQATVTPWWWGFIKLVQVRHATPRHARTCAGIWHTARRAFWQGWP